MSLLANFNFEQIKINTLKRYPTLTNIKHCVSDWVSFMQTNLNQPPHKQLELVNDYFNRKIRFIDDRENWYQPDYWATPIESLAKGAGDCEDYAIGKYLTLRLLGIPDKALQITYVKALNYNQAHMVLTYQESPTNSLILDNLVSRIIPSKKRSDLVPVYSFNAKELYLVSAGVSKYVSNTSNLSKWQELLTKLNSEGFNSNLL